MRKWMLWCLGTVLILTGCDEKRGLLPPSGGRLYEVLLVGDRGGVVDSVLQTDVTGLPQSEPQFDVSSIDSSRFNASLQLTRNIVIVHVNPQLYTSLRLRYEKNVWAEPQMVVYVNAPSARILRDSINRIAPTLLRLLNRAELRKDISMLRTKRNTRMEKLVREQFGINMYIPMEMTSSKQGKDFIWLSNNAPDMMKNIVVYKDWAQYMTTDGKVFYYSEEPSFFVSARNYMLGKNIKGEVDSMHMQTVDGTVSVRCEKANKPNKKFSHEPQPDRMFFYNGLWEMTGDDMGGPFVSRRLPLAKAETKGLYICRDIVIEGFVYAPGKKKRNAIRQLEAALYTARPEP